MQWLHNGNAINTIASGSTLPARIRLLSREVLHISKVARADKGLYQCLAYNEFDSAQAQAQVELGDEPSSDEPNNYLDMQLSLKRHERDLGSIVVLDISSPFIFACFT